MSHCLLLSTSVSHGERYRVVGLELNFKVLLVCFSPCTHEGVPSSCSRNAALFFEEIQMKNFLALCGNSFYKFNTELVQFCMKT